MQRLHNEPAKGAASNPISNRSKERRNKRGVQLVDGLRGGGEHLPAVVLNLAGEHHALERAGRGDGLEQLVDVLLRQRLQPARNPLLILLRLCVEAS